MIGIIYKYTSPSGKVYIGQTIEEKRRRKTFLNLNKSYGGIKIDSARRKFGPHNFKYEIIENHVFKSKSEMTVKLDEREEYYINQYDSYRNGYNMTFGGYTNRGFKYSEEQKKKMSLSRIGKKLPPLSDYQKAQHSELMKLKWLSDEYRSIRTQISKSEEYKQKLSESLRGENNGMYGKTHALESRVKMSQSRFCEKNYWFNKQKDADYREKISIGMKQHHQINQVSIETRDKISEKCSVSVEQYSLDGKLINAFNSIAEAGNKSGVDASCITKCCKNKRATAGGYKWKYVKMINAEDNDEILIAPEDWITTREAIELTGKCRNVLYYHIKVHGVPKIVCGRKIKINKKSLLALLNHKEE